MNMNQKARDTVRVTLTLDKAVLAALDTARIDDQLSRSNFARAALVRQLRKAGHLGGKVR